MRRPGARRRAPMRSRRSSVLDSHCPAREDARFSDRRIWGIEGTGRAQRRPTIEQFGVAVSESASAIQARGLRRTFKGNIDAVRGIDLDVAQGEIFGFLGPNGAGKTTTVRMLCTLLPPTAGSARVLDSMSSTNRPRYAGGSGWRCRRSVWTHCRPGASCLRCSAACMGSPAPPRVRAPRSCSSWSGSWTPPSGARAHTRAGCDGVSIWQRARALARGAVPG